MIINFWHYLRKNNGNPKQEISAWEQEHIELLLEIAPDEFDVLHYGAAAELRVKKERTDDIIVYAC